ncbi:sigma 54-interacting transcriptional regulator [Bacillus badius]|uniref:sigma-54 interaction domain-containing protein n=1 Tax=Bacillus badius TaxID=1455 RepID=UPI0007B0B1FB|nr:sigma 54-interacting transcriptional regulator [Bacillus badius]KZN99460.1 histidine kinase [Bacillus badius]MED0667863.1 sigma 54-interacting transcriptional regulator [Bacillus badius]OCS85297.1 histidine kinase [Bacillus badius]OVE50348.1 histidine kinase [Bacillus badius]TDW01243.1 PAS domain S-box-containing protein [Bacillus badius]
MKQPNEESSVEMTLQTLLKILDHSSDEIFVLDGEKRILYVNQACERHYGLKPTDVIGKYNVELFEKGYWKPSIVPEVYRRKKPCYLKQQTYIGAELLTSAVPLLNEAGDIELVVITSTEAQTYKMVKAKEEANESNTTHFKEEAERIVTNSEKIKQIISFCEKVAPTDSTILIEGESGTGKGVLAHFVHQISRRKNGPFLTINCAAIPEELLESELFGYAKGAFTGASKSGKPGLIEAADSGTVFLDEIGEMPLALQAKLLQVIQDKQFIPVGGSETKKVNIRIIAATNQNLVNMVKDKKFREDLFYRLNVIDIQLPPLRERREDIIPLTYNFLNKFNEKYHTNKVISEECLNILIHYDWPGNVRQLENLLERLVVISDSVIQATDLPDMITENAGPITRIPLTHTLDQALEETKRTFIRRAYQTHKSSRKVAGDLGISQTKASRLIRQYCSDLIEPRKADQ